MTEAFLHGVDLIEVNTGTRPIQTVRSSVIGIVGTAPRADVDAFPLNTPVLIAGNLREAAKLLANPGSDNGTLPDALASIFDQCGALVVVIRVAKGVDDAATLTNVVGGVDSGTGNYTGIKALLSAKGALGLTPRILCAPGFTHTRTGGNANAAAAALAAVALQLRAVAFIDAPNTNDADALDYALDFDSDRLMVVDPFVKRLNNAGVIASQPASAIWAGITARVDNDEGFWVSPSNKPVLGIVGTHRPVDFTLGDANARANLLNEGKVSTIVRENGYRTWGNLSLSSDPKWQFLCVRRTADMVNESLVRAHLWAVDRNITKTYVQDVIESVNAYLRDLVAKGAILGGYCYADPELNTPSNIQLGKVYFDFHMTPTYPAQTVTFRSHLTNEFLTEIF